DSTETDQMFINDSSMIAFRAASSASMGRARLVEATTPVVAARATAGRVRSEVVAVAVEPRPGTSARNPFTPRADGVFARKIVRVGVVEVVVVDMAVVVRVLVEATP